MALAWSIATSPAVRGRWPCVALNAAKRGGCRASTSDGDPPLVSRLPLIVSSAARLEMAPEAAATPGTARTRASVARLSTEASEPPSVSFSVMTTALLA